MEDVVVVGGGAAGLSAALVLARARRRVLVIDAGEPRNAPAESMHGFLSRDGLPPAQLLAVGRAEVEGYGGRVVRGTAEAARAVDGGFEIALRDGSVRTRRLVVATGLRDELPDIPGLRERWGHDVLHCPYCHGWEVRNQPLGVLGWQPLAVHQALLVRQWSDDVILFDSGAVFDDQDRAKLAARSVRIVGGPVAGLVVEDEGLRGVRLGDGTVVPRSALFVPPRPVPNDSLLSGLGCERDDKEMIKIDGTGRTSVPGVWAVGNVVDTAALVVMAAAAGARAATAVNLDLVEQEVSAAAVP